VKPTAGESADLKMALKHDSVTDKLRQEAEECPLEASEACFEVEEGWDTASPDSWVAEGAA
jgi:hypothetical protein